MMMMQGPLVMSPMTPSTSRTPVMAPTIAKSSRSIDLSYGMKDGSIAVDAMERGERKGGSSSIIIATPSKGGRNVPLESPRVGQSRINLSYHWRQGDNIIAVDAMERIIATPSSRGRNSPLMSPTIGRVSRIYLSHGRQGENIAVDAIE